MKKFEFRLQRVKELKEEYEKQRMQQLAEARRMLAVEQEKLQFLWERKRVSTNRIEEIKAGRRIDQQLINSCYAYITRVDSAIKEQLERIRAAEAEVEKRRKVLVQAAKERKILDNLKKRQYKSYMMEMAAKEQAVLDDLAITHYSKERYAEHGN